MANEGKMIAVIPENEANKALEVIRKANTEKTPKLSVVLWTEAE